MDKVRTAESIIDQLHLLETYLLFHDQQLDDRERETQSGEVCKMKETLRDLKEYWEKMGVI